MSESRINLQKLRNIIHGTVYEGPLQDSEKFPKFLFNKSQIRLIRGIDPVVLYENVLPH